MDPRRRGEYQGVGEVFSKAGFLWAPAVYTFLAMEWGEAGWLVIAGIVSVAALGLRGSVAMAERFAQRHFPVADQPAAAVS
jgi:hypothetical protein